MATAWCCVVVFNVVMMSWGMPSCWWRSRCSVDGESAAAVVAAREQASSRSSSSFVRSPSYLRFSQSVSQSVSSSGWPGWSRLSKLQCQSGSSFGSSQHKAASLAAAVVKVKTTG
ncbi:hypothetical protein BZA77DRAFT_152257 [Pyronema omphalodes]|nr:hypothetical protein BZA77DRAFT_152257 [Pyronema omphalodes]